MSTVIQYTENGDIDRLQVNHHEPPDAGPGQVRVHVRYAGLNPVDWKILSGLRGTVEGTSGNGTDFAGVIDQVGDGVEGFTPGQIVFGGSPSAAQSEHLIADPTQNLHQVPQGLGLDVAGGLFITGRTAMAGIRALAIAPRETVYISGASGGVGVIAAQLAVNLGARVIGSASPGNHELLRSLGVEPVEYGDGLEEALRTAAPDGIHAAYSTQDDLDLIERLGVPTNRTNSVGVGPQVTERGIHNAGSALARPDDLDWLARAIAYGHIVAPVARSYPVAEIHEAYRFLQQEHPAGKVLLRFPAPDLTQEQRAVLTG